MQNEQKARNMLSEWFKTIEIPENLDVITEKELSQLLAWFKEVPPHADFWKRLCHLVQLAFPAPERLSGSLGRQVHLFRYVVSSQQADYVRRNFMGQTDVEKLARYLSLNPSVSYSLRESDRLHHKKSQLGKGDYPIGYGRGNFKLLIGFHSEFIINSSGAFQTILGNSSHKLPLNGIVNGASFNYADRNGQDHKRLDVHNFRYDPTWRRKLLLKENYSAPLNKSGKFSYFTRYSYYALNNQSARERSSRLKREFRRKVKRHRSICRLLGFRY